MVDVKRLEEKNVGTTSMADHRSLGQAGGEDRGTQAVRTLKQSKT